MLRFLFSKLRNDTVLQHRKNVWYTSLLNQSVYKKCNYIGGVHRWCWILSFSCFFVNIFSKSLRGPPLPSIKKRVKGDIKTTLYNIKGIWNIIMHLRALASGRVGVIIVGGDNIGKRRGACGSSPLGTLKKRRSCRERIKLRESFSIKWHSSGNCTRPCTLRGVHQQHTGGYQL